MLLHHKQYLICHDIGHIEHLIFIEVMVLKPKAFMDTPDSSVNVREGGLASQIIETVSIIILIFIFPFVRPSLKNLSRLVITASSIEATSKTP